MSLLRFNGAALGRERKPTERHLDRLIAAYRREYLAAGRAAVEAATGKLREEGRHTSLSVVREAFERHTLPLLDSMEPHVEVAVRLGAARVPGERERDDKLVARIVPGVRRARAAWLRKMSGDFVTRVLAPGLDLKPRTEAAARAAEGDLFEPEDFDLGEPIETYLFPEEVLQSLMSRGYSFVRVRAVEATEHDVWKGDDLGFIGAAREEGRTTFRWRASPDDLVCPVCDGLDGETFTASEAERASADRALVSHCRCRCWFDTVDGP